MQDPYVFDPITQQGIFIADKSREPAKKDRTANDIQIDGNHYKTKAIQPWDYIVSNNIPYLEGNVIKYVSRWKDKGGLKDLEKAKHYLDKLIEVNS